MKTVCNIDTCNSCTSCQVVCPQKCISIHTSISVSNAYIDEKKCINCNKCKTVCPQINKAKTNHINKAYYYFAKNKKIRKNSSSGGVASLVGGKFINSGGYITGVYFDEISQSFEMCITNDKEMISKFRGSKYVKADINHTFRKVIDTLLKKEKVLFIGTPCQVAGIKNLVQYFKCEERLYTIDLLCHGTPSQKVFFKFLEEKNQTKEIVHKIRFRNDNMFRVSINNNYLYEKNYIKDSFTIGYLNSLFYTENCYSCQFASNERVSDLTIGDAWGKFEDPKGVSLILINTLKGKEIVKMIEKDGHFEDANLEYILKNNQALCYPSICSKQKRLKFIKRYDKMSFHKNLALCYPITHIRQVLKRIKYYK